MMKKAGGSRVWCGDPEQVAILVNRALCFANPNFGSGLSLNYRDFYGDRCAWHGCCIEVRHGGDTDHGSHDNRSAPVRSGLQVRPGNGHPPRGFVEFELSIGGAPELFVELTLPPAAFDAFCREQRVTRLNDEANP